METISTVFTTIFGGAWELFQTPVPIPGVSFTYADIVLACIFGPVALSLVIWLVTGNMPDSKGRTTHNPKISKERRNDTK